MIESDPPKPWGESPKWFFMRRVWDYLFGGKFPIKGIGNIIVEWTGKSYEISTQEARRSVSGSDSLQTARLKSRVGDMLVCRSWNGTDEGTSDIFVAVQTDAQRVDSETTGLGTFTYSGYTETDSPFFNYTRTSDDGSTTEDQMVTPTYYLNCLIRYQPVDFSGVNTWELVDGVWVESDDDLKLMEVSSRCWAKIDGA